MAAPIPVEYLRRKYWITFEKQNPCEVPPKKNFARKWTFPCVTWAITIEDFYNNGLDIDFLNSFHAAIRWNQILFAAMSGMILLNHKMFLRV